MFSSRNGDFLENWTKWKLYLLQDSGESLLVQPDMQISFSNLVKKLILCISCKLIQVPRSGSEKLISS